MIIENNTTFFKDRKLIVTLDNAQPHPKYVMIHGNHSKYMMEAKILIKNTIESLICFFVKDVQVNVKTL